MKAFIMAAIAAALLATAPAHARAHHHHHYRHHVAHHHFSMVHGCPVNVGCGCNLANTLGGISRFGQRVWRELWVAKRWRYEGNPDSRGCVGCIAVLTRRGGGHVGIVKGYDPNGNPIIHSYANGRLGWTTTTYSARRVIAYRRL